MGLSIYVLKPIQRTNENNEDAHYIFTNNFSPIKHLTKFDEGFYKCERIEAPDFYMTYGTYLVFRKIICQMALGVSFFHALMNVEKYINSPFIEFLKFADNEGSFDYAVAEKLYKDFLSLLDEAEKCLTGTMLQMYKTYMEILRIAAENKAVVFYC